MAERSPPPTMLRSSPRLLSLAARLAITSAQDRIRPTSRPSEPEWGPGKLLYGLKQAGNCWQKKARAVLATLGYQPRYACNEAVRELSWITEFLSEIQLAPGGSICVHKGGCVV